MSAHVSDGQTNGWIERHTQEQTQADTCGHHKDVFLRSMIWNTSQYKISHSEWTGLVWANMYTNPVWRQPSSQQEARPGEKLQAQQHGILDVTAPRSFYWFTCTNQLPPIFRPYPSNQNKYLSNHILEIQTKSNIHQLIKTVQKTANTRFSLPYAALYLLL